MTTIPDFSVAYRAPNIVDVLMPKQDGVDGYRLKASPQFDGTPAFVSIIDANIGGGFLDTNVDRRKLHTMPGRNKVRAVFDPNTFATGEVIDAGLLDTRQFWMKFTPMTLGVEGADSDPVLVLAPDQRHGEARIVITGSAPNAADLSGSLSLCLGRRYTGFSVRNYDGANDLFLAFNKDGPELEIRPGEIKNFDGLGPSSLLVVRGSGGAVSFSADFTISKLY